MSRGILVIFIIAGILPILIWVMLTYVIQDITVADVKGLNIINTTDDERASRSNPIAQHTPSPPVSEEDENIGIVSSLPNKCRGSALCPD